MTILSFSSSDQRRRRPVSTTSSRSTWALRLSLSIRTVLNTAPHSARRPSPDAYFVKPHLINSRNDRFIEFRSTVPLLSVLQRMKFRSTNHIRTSDTAFPGYRFRTRPLFFGRSAVGGAPHH